VGGIILAVTGISLPHCAVVALQILNRNEISHIVTCNECGFADICAGAEEKRGFCGLEQLAQQRNSLSSATEESAAHGIALS